MNADLKYFDYIIPCGISDKSVTSMQYELGRKIDMDELSEKLVVHLSNLFDFTV